VTRCFPRTRATSLVRSPALGAAAGAVEAEGAGSAAGAGRGAGSGLAAGTAGSGSAAGTVADGTGSVTFGATARVTAAVCVVGAAVLPGRTENSAQPHASPAVTAARPGKINRKFERSIGLSFSSRQTESAQMWQAPSTPGCMAHRWNFASSTGNTRRNRIASRRRPPRNLSPDWGMPMKQSRRQTRPPRAADTHPAPVSAACAPRPATPLPGRGFIPLPSLALALPYSRPIFIRGG
jgi:hypothetical protein